MQIRTQKLITAARRPAYGAREKVGVPKWSVTEIEH